MATILIIDDDEHLVDNIAKHLSAAGHQCHCERDGERALSYMRQHDIDLMILDVMLPGLSGFELCRRVRVDADCYTTPILFISAMNDAEEVHHGLAQGADDFLPKPFKVSSLVHRVENLLHAQDTNLMTDALTELPAAKSIKLDIQKAINLRRDFAVVYSELLHLVEFGRNAGAEARAKALRHLARGLNLCGQELKSDLFTVGHLGGGHFVSILEPNDVGTYCQRVRALWDKHLPKFYAAVSEENALTGPHQRATPVLDLLICATTREATSNLTSQQLFDTLTHLRQKALAGQGAGLHIDRRQ